MAKAASLRRSADAPDIDPVELGRRIRAARLEKGMTLAQVGGQDLSRSFLSTVEHGRTRISLRALSIVAHRLGRLGSAHVLASRDDLLALYSLLSHSARRLMGALLGLNRLYLPNPAFKGMDELIAEMQLRPPELDSRLRAVFRLSPTEGVRELLRLWEETLDLIDADVEGFDTAEYREELSYRRGVWDRPPE